VGAVQCTRNNKTGSHGVWVPPRARHSKNPKPVLFVSQCGEAEGGGTYLRIRQPAAAKNPSAFIFPERDAAKFDREPYILYSPRSHACNSRSTSPHITSEFVLGPHTWRRARVPGSVTRFIQSSSHFTDLHTPSSSLPRPPAPVTSKAFGTGLSPGAVGNLRSHSVIAYGAATYGHRSRSIRD